MYIYIYIYICIHMYTNMNIIYVFMGAGHAVVAGISTLDYCTSFHPSVYTNVHKYQRLHIYIYTYMHIDINIHIYVFFHGGRARRQCRHTHPRLLHILSILRRAAHVSTVTLFRASRNATRAHPLAALLLYSPACVHGGPEEMGCGGGEGAECANEIWNTS